MLKKFLQLNLRLFDGAAGASSAGTAGAGEGAAAPGDNSNAQPSAAGKGNKRANPLAGVVYGKTENDTAPQAQETQAAAEPTTTTTSDALEAKKAEFEKLIKGDYKDLFDSRVQGIIDKRFAATKTLEAQADKINPVIQTLAAKYGVAPNDIDKLSAAIDADDTYYESEAADRGISVEQLKEFKRLEKENLQFRQAHEEAERRQNADKIYSQWLEQSEAMKNIYPNFDLQAELQNESFLKMLTNGVDIKAAYQALHMDDILGGAMQYTAQAVQKQTVENIKSRASRPVENGISGQPGVVVKNDVSKLSAADRREIAKRAARGESIKF